MAEQRPLLYVGLHATDDPTLASMPFVAAVGAGAADLDTSIALLGEGASLVKPGIIESIHGVGFAPMTELAQKIRDFNIPVYV
jgi:predicted peroxiredoxin